MNRLVMYTVTTKRRKKNGGQKGKRRTGEAKLIPQLR